MTAEEINRLRDGLHDLASAPHSGPSADVAVARTRGRRILRQRRMAAIAGSAVAVGVAVAITAAVLPSGAVGTVPADRAATALSPAAASSPKGPRPPIEKASFGWLPKGYQVSDIVQESGMFSVYATNKGSQLVLTVFPPGPEPELGFMRNATPAKALPVAPVAGHPAHWLQPPPPGRGTARGEARLRVQYGPRQWAEVELDAAPTGTDVTTTVRKVAASARLRDQPAAFPVHVAGLPPSLTIGMFSVKTDGKTTLRFTGDLLITLSPSSEGGTAGGLYAKESPNTTIAGHPALHLNRSRAVKSAGATSSGAASEFLAVFDLGGLDLYLDAGPKATAALKASGGLLGLYQRTKVLGTDRSAWTTDPFG